jgi:hypothetical protein
MACHTAVCEADDVFFGDVCHRQCYFRGSPASEFGIGNQAMEGELHRVLAIEKARILIGVMLGRSYFYHCHTSFN